MPHAEGWIEAYELLDKSLPIPQKLKEKILGNKNGIGETMLHWYSIEGETRVVEKIIELGFDVNTQNKFKATPLFDCVQIERWDIVELLLKHGARTNIKNNNDEDVWAHLEYMKETENIKKLRDLTKK